MAKVALAAAAVEDLDRLVVTLTLPAETGERVRRSLVTLEQFPRLGPTVDEVEDGGELEGRWAGLRFILGPWRWLLIVYQFDEPSDRVTVVVTIQDARSSRAATAAG